MIYGFLLGLHLVICIGLVLVVLLQSGKGGGLAGAFGGGGGAGQNLFGGRGAATFLSKATTGLGIAFMTTSLVLALMAAGGGTAERSILREAPVPGTAPPPVSSQPIQIPGDQSITLPPAGDLPDVQATPVGEGETPPPTDPAPDAEGDGGDN